MEKWSKHISISTDHVFLQTCDIFLSFFISSLILPPSPELLELPRGISGISGFQDAETSVPENASIAKKQSELRMAEMRRGK